MDEKLTKVDDYIQRNCPHRNLYAAILARAILDLRENQEEYVKRGAIGYFRSTRSGKGRYISFYDCCDALDLNPKDILTALDNCDVSILRSTRS